MAQVYRSVGVAAARLAGESAAMDAAAHAVAATARSLAASHRLTGNFASGIGTARIPGKHGVTDRIAYVDDPAAASIEFGHQTRLGEGMHGPREFVEGLHIFGRAAGRA